MQGRWMWYALGRIDAEFGFSTLTWGTEAALPAHDRVLQARSITARENH